MRSCTTQAPPAAAVPVTASTARPGSAAVWDVDSLAAMRLAQLHAAAAARMQQEGAGTLHSQHAQQVLASFPPDPEGR